MSNTSDDVQSASEYIYDGLRSASVGPLSLSVNCMWRSDVGKFTDELGVA